jgi:hypothetical protein
VAPARLRVMVGFAARELGCELASFVTRWVHNKINVPRGFTATHSNEARWRRHRNEQHAKQARRGAARAPHPRGAPPLPAPAP